MLHIKSFVFNPFQENTWVVSDEMGRALIFDPGNSSEIEDREIVDYLSTQQLRPEAIVLTHAHLDHVMGVNFLKKTYGIPVWGHRLCGELISRIPEVCGMYGLPYFHCPLPDSFLQEGDLLRLGDHVFEVLYCPGHSPDHLVFVHTLQEFIIAGDVLFKGSIGRTDLMGGSYEDLVGSIRDKLWVLPGSYQVYCGHGAQTTIGQEMRSNPYVGMGASGARD